MPKFKKNFGQESEKSLFILKLSLENHESTEKPVLLWKNLSKSQDHKSHKSVMKENITSFYPLKWLEIDVLIIKQKEWIEELYFS